jgi:hypothetical protein
LLLFLLLFLLYIFHAVCHEFCVVYYAEAHGQGYSSH